MVSKKVSVVAPKIDVEKSQAENPNSRFRVINLAVLPPGTCFVCGSAGGPERQFVDFGKGIDFFGAVYICTFCVTEVATLLGFATPEGVAIFEGQIEGYKDQIRSVEVLYANLDKDLNAARLLLRNCHCFDSDSVVNASGPVSLDGEFDGEAESDVADGNESGSVEGFDDISESSNDVDESESRD